MAGGQTTHKFVQSVRTPLSWFFGLLFLYWFLSAGGGLTIKSFLSGRMLVILVLAFVIYYIFPLVSQKGAIKATELLVSSIILTLIFVTAILTYLPRYLKSLDATQLESVAQEAWDGIDTSTYDNMEEDVLGLKDVFAFTEVKDPPLQATRASENPADVYVAPVPSGTENTAIPTQDTNVGGGAPITQNVTSSVEIIPLPTPQLVVPHEAELSAIKQAIDNEDLSALFINAEALRAVAPTHPLLDSVENTITETAQRKANLFYIGMPSTTGEKFIITDAMIEDTKMRLSNLELQIKTVEGADNWHLCDAPVTLEVLSGWLKGHTVDVGRCTLVAIITKENVKPGYTFIQP